MPEKEKKPWYQKAWGKVVAAISVIVTLGAILEGGYLLYGFYDEYKQMQATMELLVEQENSFETRISHVEEFVNRKNKSYAVGFRVVTVTDEETGRQTKRKKYRGWDGEEHTVYLDKEFSEQQGIDYYFWIAADGSINYCW